MFFFRFFKNLRIRQKLLFGYFFVFLLLVMLGNGIVYFHIHKIISDDLQRTIEQTTKTSAALIESSINLSIRNHLYAHSLENEGLVKHYYKKVQDGTYTKEDAQKIVSDVFLKETFGKEGYIFIMNPEGILLYHPNPVLRGKSIVFNKDLAKILKNPKGYFEYDWKNPYDKIRRRPKALYAFCFKPWDWIVCVSVYESDFKSLLDIEDFRKYLESMEIEYGGYPFVLDGSGKIVIHPYLRGEAFKEWKKLEKTDVFDRMAKLRNGSIEYYWRNPGEKEYSKKRAFITYIPELDWIVGTTSYSEEYFTRFYKIRNIFFASSALILAVLIPISIAISSSITKPIQKIITEFSRGAEGDLSVRVPVESKDEIGILSGYFNNFMADLEEYQKNLENEISARQEAQHERKLVEEQLIHSQKMEAMGQLTGGIAHDFNNLLTAIMGNAELLNMEFEGKKEYIEYIEQIYNASKRAKDLTKHLLRFSRKKTLEITDIKVNKIVSDTIGLLKHSLAKNININEELAAENDEIVGDASQIQNTLLNLGINARDAMPDGGELTFSTRNVIIDDEYCRKHPFVLSPGPYVQISVTDTGIGMDEEMQAKIFDPFFTTKAEGKGTGLGLASVYGCVKAHQGSIDVYSEKGYGTSFKIYLPPNLTFPQVPDKTLNQKIAKGTCHVLLVDDEEFVRNYAVKALQSFGYSIKSCSNGLEALEYFKANHDKVNLVILDMIMPEITGKQTFEGLQKIDPSIPVLLCSGFTDEPSIQELLKQGAGGFLGKPFTIPKLSQMVASLINNPND